MAEGVKCPVMKWGTGDDQSALTEFKKRITRWFVIRDINVEKQHNYIIFQGGEEAEMRAKTWSITDDELKDPNNVWELLGQSVGLADNFRIHRLTLGSMKQRDEESIDEFYTRVRDVGMKCRFKDLDDRLIDQLIKGTKCSDSRKELLCELDTLTIDDALKKCRKHEASEAHMKAFMSAEIHSGIGSRVDAVNMREKSVKDCRFCARDHPSGRCPAFATKCKQCGRKGHWKVKCRADELKYRQYDKHTNQHSGKSTKNQHTRKVHAVEVKPMWIMMMTSVMYNV